MKRHGKTLKKTRFDSNEIVKYGNYAEIILNDSDGNEKNRAKVDLEDVEILSQHKWWEDGKGYAQAIVDGERVQLQRLVLPPTDGYTVDHINRDRMDNRKSSLRLCTVYENNRNSTRSEPTETTPFTGVYKNSGGDTYYVRITYNHEVIYLGSYRDLEEAISVRLKAEDKYFGEFAPIENLKERC